MYYILHSNHSSLLVDDSTTAGSRDSRQPQTLHRRIHCSISTGVYTHTVQSRLHCTGTHSLKNKNKLQCLPLCGIQKLESALPVGDFTCKRNPRWRLLSCRQVKWNKTKKKPYFNLLSAGSEKSSRFLPNTSRFNAIFLRKRRRCLAIISPRRSYRDISRYL